MKCSTARVFVVGAMVMSVAVVGEVGATSKRSGWYIGGGIGVNWTSRIDQEGWNRDTFCYPEYSPCLSGGMPGKSDRLIQGFRWMYDFDLDAGSVFEMTAGRIFDRWRLELSATQRNNAIDQIFAGIDYDPPVEDQPLIFNPCPDPVTGSRDCVVSNANPGIDDLTTRTIAFNVYYDFPDLLSNVPNPFNTMTNPFERLTPYVGVGLGVAFVKIDGVRFETDYRNLLTGSDKDLKHLNSVQNVDMSDTVILAKVHAGADYSLTDETLLGMKLTYSIMDDAESSNTYSDHPMFDIDSNFSGNRTTFSGPRELSVMFTMKYLFGD